MAQQLIQGRPIGFGSVMLLLLVLAVPAAGAGLGTAFTYRGRLVVGGSPANGTYDFQFTLYDAENGGTNLGTATVDNVTVAGGLFTAALDFGEGAVTGQARWLAIGVRPGASTGAYTALSPRQELRPSPHALALPALWVEQNATSPNIIGGHVDNFAAGGIQGATISGGGRAGDVNQVMEDFGAIGGGSGNIISGGWATIGGGYYNAASSEGTTVGGGEINTASRLYATVGGGYGNTSSGQAATVGGGGGNDASGNDATIAGGEATQPTTLGLRWEGDHTTPPVGIVPSFPVGHTTRRPGNTVWLWVGGPMPITMAASS